EVVTVGHHLLRIARKLPDYCANQHASHHQLRRSTVSSVREMSVPLGGKRDERLFLLTGIPGGASTIISQFVHSLLVR
ncbi:hypothetical protein PMAYCL1PPCAC_23098, partial [Pristionchus mayeri]